MSNVKVNSTVINATTGVYNSVVTSVELVIDADRNNSDFLNDYLIPQINALPTSVSVFGGSFEWCRNLSEENVLRFDIGYSEEEFDDATISKAIEEAYSAAGSKVLHTM
jgi:hypothetical protein